MRVQPLHACRGATPAQHLRHPVRGHRALAPLAEPHGGASRKRVTSASAQGPLERLGRLDAEGAMRTRGGPCPPRGRRCARRGPLSSRASPASSDRRMPVSMNKPHDGRVPSGGEVLAVARAEHGALLGDRQDRHGLGGHDRRLHPRHRVGVDLLLVHEPREELLQRAVAKADGRRLARGGQAAEVLLDRRPRERVSPAASGEVGELAGRLGVVGDGARRGDRFPDPHRPCPGRHQGFDLERLRHDLPPEFPLAERDAYQCT